VFYFPVGSHVTINITKKICNNKNKLSGLNISIKPIEENIKSFYLTYER
jgi:hypothetical protein